MKLTSGPRSFARPTSRRSDPRDPGEIFRNARSAKMTAHGTSETPRCDPAKRHRFENADMRLAWRSCRRTFSATREKKRFFVPLTTFCYHFDGDASDGDDCRGGMRLSHFRANSVAISLILTPAAVAVLSAALWAARAASRLRTLSNASIGVLGLTMRSFLRL